MGIQQFADAQRQGHDDQRDHISGRLVLISPQHTDKINKTHQIDPISVIFGDYAGRIQSNLSCGILKRSRCRQPWTARAANNGIECAVTNRKRKLK